MRIILENSAFSIQQHLLKSMYSRAAGAREKNLWTSVLLVVCLTDRITWLENYFIMFESNSGTTVLSSIFVSLGRIFPRQGTM